MSLERAQLGLMAAIAATCLVSIFATQVFLALALVVYLTRLGLGRARFERLPVDGPFLAFSVWTLLSASFSPEPVVSYDSAKKLVLFALLYLSVDSLAEEGPRERILDAALLGGLVLGAGALIQYYLLGYDTVQHRPQSFMGHYMTASGLSMGILVLGTARLVFRRVPFERPSRDDLKFLATLGVGLGALAALQKLDLFALDGERIFVAGLAVLAAVMALARGKWPGRATGSTLTLLAVPVAAWALLVSRTRNAWLGALAGLAVIVIAKAPRALWLIPAGVAAILLLRPAPVVDRLTVTDASSRDRYYMWQAGLDMIRDKPVFGQGPGMILKVYPEYRWPEAPNPTTPHLHDNVLQIAAERGLPCLAWWLWGIAALMGDAYRESRREAAPPWGPVAALALLVAVLVAGMFEYNFGDSEILMLLLLVSALPYAHRRERTSAPAS